MTEPLLSEKELVQAAQKGSGRAFGALYDHYLPPIYRFVFYKIMNRQDAEDICHHVFLNAWQNIQSYRDIGHSFSSWLYRIARNAVIDFYRTQKHSLNLSDVMYTLADNTNLEQSAADTLEIETVLYAIKELNEEHREIIVMRFIEDLDNDEIAAILEKSNGAVRILQHRALHSLRKILKQQGMHIPQKLMETEVNEI
jgi:RNA polymerase sigma-70 factor, ECF subfamily